MLLEELPEVPRGLIAESSAPLPIIQYPDGHTEPAPASSVHAKDIIGLLTSEQIEELAAAKIAGKLTAEQIESINAAQIVGVIVNEQIGSIAAGKITGELENAQIKSLTAAKITGEITEAQIAPESITTLKLKALNVTAAKIAAGAIIAEKIGAEAVEASKIKALTITAGQIAANAITTEKVNALAVTTAKLAAESVVAEKISASAITTTKLAVSAVTAEKISVATLSAISVNAGTITAGTFKGTTFETAEEGLKINNEGIVIFANEEALPGSRHKIEWKKTATTIGEIYFKLTGANTINLIVNKAVVAGFESARTEIQASGKENQNATLFVSSAKGVGAIRSLAINLGGVTRTIFEEPGEKSNFLQLGGGAEGFVTEKRRITFGTNTLTWTASAFATTKEIEHGLKVVPSVVLCTSSSAAQTVTVNSASKTSTKFKVEGFYVLNVAISNTVSFDWIAIG